MLLLFGALIIIASVIGGFIGEGGKLAVLIQPWEILIILGSALGAFLIANTKDVVHKIPRAVRSLIKGPEYTKQSYIELLTLLYVMFRFIRTKGVAALEPHVESPHTSAIFSQFPSFIQKEENIIFLCDYLRLLTMGSDNPSFYEESFEEDIHARKHEALQPSHALLQIGDGLPALGIVAAVLGVIITMGSLSEPPETLGKLIGAALSGTFFGVLFAYGFITPVGQGIQSLTEERFAYFEVIKAAFLSHLKGVSPAIAIEFARKTLAPHVQPSFAEVDAALAHAPML